MLAELEREHYQVKVAYLGFMKQYFICVQLISLLALFVRPSGEPRPKALGGKAPLGEAQVSFNYWGQASLALAKLMAEGHQIAEGNLAYS